MAGLQEILTLLVIIAAIIMLPRLFQGRRPTRKTKTRPPLSGGIRLGVMASVLLPVAAGLVLKPWEGRFLIFIAAGIVPVIAGWGIAWVVSGFRRKKT